MFVVSGFGFKVKTILTLNLTLNLNLKPQQLIVIKQFLERNTMST